MDYWSTPLSITRSPSSSRAAIRLSRVKSVAAKTRLARPTSLSAGPRYLKSAGWPQSSRRLRAAMSTSSETSSRSIGRTRPGPACTPKASRVWQTSNSRSFRRRFRLRTWPWAKICCTPLQTMMRIVRNSCEQGGQTSEKYKSLSQDQEFLGKKHFRYSLFSNVN